MEDDLNILVNGRRPPKLKKSKNQTKTAKNILAQLKTSKPNQP
jgi:hypothetical protein